MTIDTEALSPAQRKKRLVMEGALYRSRIIDSRNAVRSSLRSESIAKNVLGQLTMVAYTVFKSGIGLKSGGVQALLPILMNGISAISRKTSLKPVLRSAAVVAVVGVLGSFFARRKKAQQAARGKK